MENTIVLTTKEKADELTSRINANAAVAAQSLVAIGRDLKMMRDEKLYTELGCADFGEYCDKHTQVRQRQAYNFIRCYEKFGERLGELSGLGITKLALLSALDDEDSNEIIQSGAAENSSTRELEKLIEEYKNKYEQLVLDFDNSEKALKTANIKLDELNRFSITRAEQRNKLIERCDELEKRCKELENRPVEVAVQPPSEEEIKKIKDEAVQSVQKAAEKAADAAQKQHKQELDKLRSDLAKQYEQTSKENAEQSKKEIERLKSENAILQANAKNQQKLPDELKARVKFYLEEMQKAFNSAVETVRSVEDSEQRSNYVAAFKSVVSQMSSILEQCEQRPD